MEMLDTMSVVIIDMMSKILVRTNFDIEKLAKYEIYEG